MHRVILVLLLFTSAAQADSVKLRFMMSQDAYTVPVNVEVSERQHRSLQLVFDTGSGYTVLPRAEVETLGLLKGTPMEVTSPEGGVRQVMVVRATLVIGRCRLPYREVIVADLPDGQAGSLGLREIAELVPFTFDNGKLTFSCQD